MTVKVSRLVFFVILLVSFGNITTKGQISLGINWQKSFGGTGSDRGTRILLASDGNLVTMSVTNSSLGDVPPLLGNSSINITKFTREGVKLWSNNFGNTALDGLAEAGGFSETSDKGFIITGSINKHCFNTSPTTGPAESDIWVIKTDSAGNLQWEKCHGGSQPDIGNAIVQKPNGNYIVTGHVKSNDF